MNKKIQIQLNDNNPDFDGSPELSNEDSHGKTPRTRPHFSDTLSVLMAW